MYPIKANKLTITSKYGNRSIVVNGKTEKSFHKGIDLIANPKNNNAEILAFEDGIVTDLCETGKQYGRACFIRIKHNVYYTLYYHLKSASVSVKVGQKVKKNQVIGIIGKTGKSTGVHLHFQIDKGNSKTAIDPYDYVFKGKKLNEEVKTGFFPSKGYFTLGDNDKNIGLISNFMYENFPLYTKKEALGNYYGKNIQSSIREFQTRTGLEPDGNVGRKTLAMLEKYGFTY